MRTKRGRQRSCRGNIGVAGGGFSGAVVVAGRVVVWGVVWYG